MGQETIKFCDSCKGKTDVSTLTLAYGPKRTTSWELDLCQKCFDKRLGDLKEAARRPTVGSVKPVSKMRKTELKPENL